MEIIIAIGYWALIFGLLFILIFLVAFLFTSLWSSFSGVPFVGSQQRKIHRILAEAHPKRGAIFYDLGSGDGRVVYIAAKQFGMHATGIESNPLLIFFSNSYKRLFKLQHAHFKRGNLFRSNFSDADVIYLFLFPRMIQKLVPIIHEQCRPGTVIISHGFEIEALNSKLTHTLTEKPFSTYYYTL